MGDDFVGGVGQGLQRGLEALPEQIAQGRALRLQEDAADDARNLNEARVSLLNEQADSLAQERGIREETKALDLELRQGELKNLQARTDAILENTKYLGPQQQLQALNILSEIASREARTAQGADKIALDRLNLEVKERISKLQAGVQIGTTLIRAATDKDIASQNIEAADRRFLAGQYYKQVGDELNFQRQLTLGNVDAFNRLREKGVDRIFGMERQAYEAKTREILSDRDLRAQLVAGLALEGKSQGEINKALGSIASMMASIPSVASLSGSPDRAAYNLSLALNKGFEDIKSGKDPAQALKEFDAAASSIVERGNDAPPPEGGPDFGLGDLTNPQERRALAKSFSDKYGSVGLTGGKASPLKQPAEAAYDVAIRQNLDENGNLDYQGFADTMNKRYQGNWAVGTTLSGEPTLVRLPHESEYTEGGLQTRAARLALKAIRDEGYNKAYDEALEAAAVETTADPTDKDTIKKVVDYHVEEQRKSLASRASLIRGNI